MVLQDSIQSVLGAPMGSSLPIDAKHLEPEQKQQVKELVFYNVDRRNYFPFFRERKQEQDERKK